MTPEDKASEIIKWLPADKRHATWVAIRDALHEAIESEREACARLAEEHAQGAGEVCLKIAAAIRARALG